MLNIRWIIIPWRTVKCFPNECSEKYVQGKINRRHLISYDNHGVDISTHPLQHTPFNPKQTSPYLAEITQIKHSLVFWAMLRVETGVVCFSHLQSTLLEVEYSGDREPVWTEGWAQEASCLAVIHIFTAIRTQPSHRKTRSERSGNYTNAVMTFKRPPLSGEKTFLKTTVTQLEHAEAHTCLRHDKANLVTRWLQVLVRTRTWHAALHHTSCFHPPATFLPAPCVYLPSWPLNSVNYCIFCGWQWSQTNKTSCMIDFMMVWLFFVCKCGFVSSKKRKTAMDVLELICLRDGLECEVLNTDALQNSLHFLLLLLHIIYLTAFISGYFRPFVQHLCQTWFQII